MFWWVGQLGHGQSAGDASHAAPALPFALQNPRLVSSATSGPAPPQPPRMLPSAPVAQHSRATAALAPHLSSSATSGSAAISATASPSSPVTSAEEMALRLTWVVYHTMTTISTPLHARGGGRNRQHGPREKALPGASVCAEGLQVKGDFADVRDAQPTSAWPRLSWCWCQTLSCR